jgi:ATP-binding cassette subfamily F protein 3
VSHDRELLRGLTTRTWVLHERRVTDFDGGFAEWEEVSAERAHAAAVREAEDRAVRRVHERQRVAPARQADSRGALRRAQRALQEAEAAVAALESRMGPVVSALEDPTLYTRPGGPEEAHRLGTELERLKRDLDGAMERWARAGQEVEELS